MEPGPRAERARHRESRGSRILVPMAFIALGGILVYALLHAFLNPPETVAVAVDADPRVVAGPVVDPPLETPPDGGAGDSLPTLRPAPRTLAPEDVLRKFIRASSSAARLIHSEPSYEKEALEGSPLDSAQLQCSRIEPMHGISSSGDGFVDDYFRAEFQLENGRESPTLVAVRSFPGTDRDPKVLIDPLLDLIVGGRLEAFAADPGQPEGTFRVLLEPVPRRFEDEIQGVDPRIALRLRPTTDTPEIAEAYVPEGSPLADQLIAMLDASGTGDSKLKWGRREPATVSLRWNDGKAAPPEETPASIPASAGDSGLEPNDDPASALDDTGTPEPEEPDGVEEADEATGDNALDDPDRETTSAAPDGGDPGPAPAAPRKPFIELIGIRRLDWSP